MKNTQPIFSIETLTDRETSPNVLLPRLSLPQVTQAQLITKRQHAREESALVLQRTAQTTSFPQTPVTPPLTEPLLWQPPILPAPQEVSLLSGPQVPFPTPRLDFSRSLRSGITYIPRSMTRRKEPSIVDALIACGTLITIGLLLLMLLYYLSL